MITFIFLAFGAIFAIGAFFVAYNARKGRSAGGSGEAVAESEMKQKAETSAERPTGIN